MDLRLLTVKAIIRQISHHILVQVMVFNDTKFNIEEFTDLKLMVLEVAVAKQEIILIVIRIHGTVIATEIMDLEQ